MTGGIWSFYIFRAGDRLRCGAGCQPAADCQSAWRWTMETLPVFPPARPLRVPLDVMNNPLKLRIIADQSVIALVLPEWLASESQHSVAFPGSESLERLHHLGNCLQWSHQEMNVVRHNDKRMELIGPLVPIVNGIHHHLRDLGHAQEERAGTGGVEDTVHGQECSSGNDCRGK